MNNKAFIIPIELVEALLNYLAMKPYNEVHAFIAALVKLQEVESGNSPSNPTI